MVWTAGFEPAASPFQTGPSTRLTIRPDDVHYDFTNDNKMVAIRVMNEITDY